MGLTQKRGFNLDDGGYTYGLEPPHMGMSQN